MAAHDAERKPASTLLLLLVSAGLAVGGLVLLGIPGAVFMTAVLPLAYAVIGPEWMEANFTGDNAEWPFAIYLSLIWPFLLWPCYRLAARHAGRPRPPWWRVLAYFLLSGFVLAFVGLLALYAADRLG
ncbi:MAG TPA: hypothetical protein VK002_01350 [Rubricoccaceae bacterium]|jgi:drug/metabolite transporter (DMT)-like permease|nr:hypothetical protein [Rubricoccaceae bacterium]